MTTGVHQDYAEIFFEHFCALRKYAERRFLDGAEFDATEEEDRTRRMREFLAIGDACEFTHRQMVSLLYAELF
jgi:hypothetical protein